MLIGEAQNGDAAFRKAALLALADSQQAAALPALVKGSGNGTEDDKATAVAGINHLAEVFGEQGKGALAGRAYLEAYRVAETSEQREAALEGIQRYPTAEAVEVAEGGRVDEVPPDLLVSVLTAIADAQLDNSDIAGSKSTLSKLLPHIRTTAHVHEATALARRLQIGPEIAPKLGFITSWLLVGPFPWKSEEAFTRRNINEPNIDLTATYTVAGKQLEWTSFTTPDAAGIVHLPNVFGPNDNVTVYAHAEIVVENAKDVVFRMGSDDGIKLWVNGEVVYENDTGRALVVDQDAAKARLKAGRNQILFQITQSIAGWGFCARITEPDGRPVEFAQ